MNKLIKFINEVIEGWKLMEEDYILESSFADSLRKDMINDFLQKIQDDEEREELSEPPDYDLLLEPDHFDGYEYQTYIQYVDENTFKYYEGFSVDCWFGFMKQPQYKGKSKPEIIKSFVGERARMLGSEFGYELKDFDYFIHESMDYTDYILVLTYKK